MQESLSPCEAILSLAKDTEQEDEEENSFDGVDRREEEDVEGTTKRLETLKALTETVMSMIECSSRATRRVIPTTKKPPSGLRALWTPKEEVEATIPPPPGTTNNTKKLKNEKNSILNNNKMEEARLDEEFQDENSYENYVNYFKSQGILFPRSLFSSPAKTPGGGGKTSRQGNDGGCEKNVIYQRDNKQRMDLKLALNERFGDRELVKLSEGVVDGEMIEDCEYDSDNGMFNCSDDGAAEEWKGSGQGRELKQGPEKDQKKKDVNKNNELSPEQKKGAMNKKIEYFENKLKPSKADNRLREAMTQGGCKVERGYENRNEVQVGIKGKEVKEEEDERKKMINILCLGSFFLTALLLYLFPLPN